MSDEMTAPLHGKAAEFRRLGLFAGIKTFSELERRIEALTSEKQKGDAFEVFAEAYLATQRVGIAKHVWPDKAIPPSIRKRLRLSARDVGADGVIETVSGKCRAYQVKFRSRRAPLTWTDTATFLGVTDHCDDRLLFTNSEDVSQVAEQRKDFSSIRGTDLDALTAADFEAIRIWLAGRPIVRKPSSPRPYQQRTLAAILPALNQQDRATAVMACGTGKTFVALWVAEAIVQASSTNSWPISYKPDAPARGDSCDPSLARRAKIPFANDSDFGTAPKWTVLVLVPALALLRQTLREWIKNTSWENSTTSASARTRP